jgi:flagellar biosynthesis protein FlhF
MRLKAYTAATVADAMQQIRAELGDDAVIVSTETKDGETRVVAAIDPADPAPEPGPPRRAPQPVAWPTLGEKRPSARAASPAAARPANGHAAALNRALAHHGVPDPITDALIDGAAATSDAAAALAERMKASYRFDNLADRRETTPILLAGPPGAGKTLVTAKLAARGVLNGQVVRVITTDIGSAGAVEQLTAFTQPLQIELETADGPAALARTLTKRLPGTPLGAQVVTIIDTAGVNPFDAVEMAGLAALIVASRADPALVLGAGGDARDAAEMAEAFADIGCNRLIVTRLDLARRYGNVLAAATAGRMALAETGASPIVAHGLQPLNPRLLARLFVNEGRA